MLIVGIDTSWKHGGIALGRGDAAGFEVLGSSPIAGGTFSAQLVPQLASLLQKHNLKKEDIDGIVAASGPGSFTGLRVGLAAVKGLAEILGTPIARVSVLEALAAFSGVKGKVAAVLDAGRGELFVGTYRIDEGGRTTALRSEALLAQAAFAVEPGMSVVTPDKTIADAAWRHGARVHLVERPGAEVIARLGLAKILAGETVTPEQLDANYIRRSDAEIFAKPRA